MKAKLVALIGVAVLVAAACSSSDTTDPAGFGVDVNDCVEAPAAVPGITVLGHRVGSISDLSACVDLSVDLAGVPTLVNEQGCGDPCFGVWWSDLDVSADTSLTIAYKQDGKPAAPITLNPDEVAVGQDLAQRCIVGVGTPDPCVASVDGPNDLRGTAKKKKNILAWDAAIARGGETLAGYELQFSLTGEEGSWQVLTTTDASQRTFEHTGLTRATTYWYVVRAVTDSGLSSEQSNILELTTR